MRTAAISPELRDISVKLEEIRGRAGGLSADQCGKSDHEISESLSLMMEYSSRPDCEFFDAESQFTFRNTRFCGFVFAWRLSRPPRAPCPNFSGRSAASMSEVKVGDPAEYPASDLWWFAMRDGKSGL